MEKQLLRSRNNKMIAGVCGGIAEYFSVDPTIVRIIWAAVALAFPPGGIIAYIVAAIVMPEGQTDSPELEGQHSYEDQQNNEDNENDNQSGNAGQAKEPERFDPHKTRLVIGGALIFLGALFLAKEFMLFDPRYIWPLVFIGIGTFIIYKGGRGR